MGLLVTFVIIIARSRMQVNAKNYVNESVQNVIL